MRQTREFPRGLFGLGNRAAGAQHTHSARNRYVAAAIAATVVAVMAITFWVVASASPVLPGVQDGTTNLSPRSPLTLSVWNLGGAVQQATLTEAIYDINGNLGPSHEIPVHLVPVSSGNALALRSDYRVERTDGSTLMTFDGVYKLTVAATSSAAALAGQKTAPHTYTYTTLPSPRLFLPAGVVPLDYQKPVELHWNRPIESFKAETVPALDVRTWVDPNRADVSYVELTGAKPDTQYVVRVTDAMAVNGGQLVTPAQVSVLTPAPPSPLTDKVKLEEGYRIALPWDRAIKSVDYQITPAVGSTLTVGGADPSQSYILLQDPKQGQDYTVTINGAVASTGYPLSSARQVKVRTPDPLKIASFDPKQPEYGVPLGTGINITFDKPVKDRAAAEAAIKISPAVKGKFVWKAPNVVQFAPTGNLPEATDFTVSVLGGRSGAISQDGGYLDKTQQFAFWTALSKEIEVNLSSQTLTLWEDGKPVWDTLVSTGVRYAETPTGRYTVQYKLPSTRMRGTNPSGHTYDLPGVPWVLPFMGDYTLHGAYWRDTYGVPQSNGCVSMPVPAAKVVYDWADVGTVIRIHY